MAAIRELDFEASAEVTGLELCGSADARIVPELDALLAELHAELLAAHATEIAIDIRKLEFMNATCFNVLVNWLALVNDLPPERRYRLRFATNAAIPWQRRSLHTLSCFATDLVVIE